MTWATSFPPTVNPKSWRDAMVTMLLSLPVLFLTLHGCASNRTKIAQSPQDRQVQASAQAADDQTEEGPTARAHRLDAATIATVPVAPLTSQDDLDEYISRLADLRFLIVSAEKDPFIQSARSNGRLYIHPSLARAREALASGMITKGKAELARKDFEAARKTLRRVLVEFDSKVYGGLTRQAEVALQDVEKAAELAEAQGRQ